MRPRDAAATDDWEMAVQLTIANWRIFERLSQEP